MIGAGVGRVDRQAAECAGRPHFVGQLGRIFDGWYAHRLWLIRKIGAGVGRVDRQAAECAGRPHFVGQLRRIFDGW